MTNDRKRTGRVIDLTIDIDATLDEVWQALTTGEGIARWFAPHAAVTPGERGSVSVGWDPKEMWTQPITLWEPLRRMPSNRTGTLGSNDLWVSTRPSVDDAWSGPVNLGSVVNSPFNDLQPSLSCDRRTLIFASDRPGGSGNLDLYVVTRTKGEDRP